MPALLQAEAAFNNQTVGLVNALLAQSGSTGTELGIANGIWAKELPVSKEYADAMWRLYRVSSRQGDNGREHSVMDWMFRGNRCTLHIGLH